jgi:hypothetical protein
MPDDLAVVGATLAQRPQLLEVELERPRDCKKCTHEHIAMAKCASGQKGEVRTVHLAGCDDLVGNSLRHEPLQIQRAHVL